MFPPASSSVVTVLSTVLVVSILMMMATGTEAAPRPNKNGAVLLHLDPNILVPSRNIRPLQNVSISPWTYESSNDDSLYPPMMSEARCLLQGCLDRDGKEDQNLRSRPIMYEVMVLRRVKTGGEEQSYHYRLESRLISVGCTCVRHVVHVQE